jgi:hypothetical protein
MRAEMTDRLNFLADELENFTEIVKILKPSAGERPRLDGIDVDAASLPLNGAMGGDQLIYLDFKYRFDLEGRIEKARAEGRDEIATQLEENKHRAGILLADVAGHRMTDAAVPARRLLRARDVGSDHDAAVREDQDAVLRIDEHQEARGDALRGDHRPRPVPVSLRGSPAPDGVLA